MHSLRILLPFLCLTLWQSSVRAEKFLGALPTQAFGMGPEKGHRIPEQVPKVADPSLLLDPDDDPLLVSPSQPMPSKTALSPLAGNAAASTLPTRIPPLPARPGLPPISDVALDNDEAPLQLATNAPALGPPPATPEALPPAPTNSAPPVLAFPSMLPMPHRRPTHPWQSHRRETRLRKWLQVARSRS